MLTNDGVGNLVEGGGSIVKEGGTNTICLSDFLHKEPSGTKDKILLSEEEKFDFRCKSKCFFLTTD